MRITLILTTLLLLLSASTLASIGGVEADQLELDDTKNNQEMDSYDPQSPSSVSYKVVCQNNYYKEWHRAACDPIRCAPDEYLNCEKKRSFFSSNYREVCTKQYETTCSEKPTCREGYRIIEDKTCEGTGGGITPIPKTCKDTDNGENHDIQGTVTVYYLNKTMVKTDACLDPDNMLLEKDSGLYLREYICNEGDPAKGIEPGTFTGLVIKCENGCANGICIKSDYQEYYLRVGDKISFEGKTITLLNVGSNENIAVDVNGVVETITVKEKVNGIEIVIVDTFYVDEKAERTATIRLKLVPQLEQLTCSRAETKTVDWHSGLWGGSSCQESRCGEGGKLVDCNTRRVRSIFRYTQYQEVCEYTGESYKTECITNPTCREGFTETSRTNCEELTTCKDYDNSVAYSLSTSGIAHPPGPDRYIASNVQVSTEEKLTDYCYGENSVIEAVCIDGKKADYVMPYECLHGCQDGRCVGPENEYFVRTGNTNVFLSGYDEELIVQNIGKNAIVLQIGKQLKTINLGVTERFDQYGGIRVTLLQAYYEDIKEYRSALIVVEANNTIPPEPKPTCEDSDGGIGLTTKGRVTKLEQEHYVGYDDYCVQETNSTTGWYAEENGVNYARTIDNSCTGENCYIAEAYCSEVPREVFEVRLCQNGCDDGACIEKDAVKTFKLYVYESVMLSENTKVTLLNAGAQGQAIVNISGAIETVTFQELEVINNVEVTVVDYEYVDYPREQRWVLLQLKERTINTPKCYEGSYQLINCNNTICFGAQKCISGGWVDV
ncbi:hypothetical protein GOV04_04775 [Candidatus Woesearchaeota archaeon]|nr:hypothetical protein [Candidatus Woesearchaeota archaeon]